MPEPITVTVPPEQHDPAVAVSTGDWKGSAPAADAAPPDSPTVTVTVASTPGPGHAGRETDSDDTEVVPLPPGEHPALPQIPGYRVEEEIGNGGMGVVYRAIDLKLAKTVALKVIFPRGRDPKMVRGRYDREVQTLARIEHPNVVPVYHAGDWYGYPYFTMKHVPGGSLAQHLGRFTGDNRACATLVAKVARAVQVLHDHKIIHRDLKPLNILMGDGDEPLVADFGLAKWLDDNAAAGAATPTLSYTGVAMGTRQYMSPEQTRGESSELRAQCDIWALGVTLYELLAGVRPFPDDGSSDLSQRICEEAPPPLPNTVPPELAAVVWMCLGKRPEERYATAADVAADLEKWLIGEPVSVPVMVAPPGNPPRRRSRWLVPAALLGLVALIALPASLFPQRTPPPEKTIAERLRDWETVWLVPQKGSPLVPTHPVPGNAVSTMLTRKGYTTITSAGTGLVELSNEVLPWPVRLRAEYALTGAGDELSRAGVYVARKVTPGTKGVWQSLVVLSHRSESAQPVFGFSLARESFGFSARVWLNDSPGTTRDFAGASRLVLTPKDPNETEWRTVDVILDPDRISGSFAGIPVDAVYGTTVPGTAPSRSVEVELGALARNNAPGVAPFAPPHLGAGIGLYVLNAEAVFRNVTLERIER